MSAMAQLGASAVGLLRTRIELASVEFAEMRERTKEMLVLGAVGSSPVDQSPLSAPLVGQRPSREAIKSVAAEAYKGARPLDNTDLNYAWRKKMTRVYVERALARVCGVEP